jgi:hypothetical protein
MNEIKQSLDKINAYFITSPTNEVIIPIMPEDDGASTIQPTSASMTFTDATIRKMMIGCKVRVSKKAIAAITAIILDELEQDITDLTSTDDSIISEKRVEDFYKKRRI